MAQNEEELLNKVALPPGTLEQLLSGLLEVAIRATDASEGSIILLDKDRELLTMGLAGGPKKSLVRSPQRDMHSISSWVVQHKEPLLLIGLANDPRFSGVERQIKDALCVPLVSEDEVIGVFSVSNKQGRGNFSQGDLDKLNVLAAPSARVIASTMVHVEEEEKRYIWERRHLAQEIHDGLIQELTAVVLQLQVYERLKEKDPEKCQEHLERIKQQVKVSLQGLRRLVFQLRLADVEKANFVSMLEDSVESFEKATGIKASFTLKGRERGIPVQAKRNLVAIVQEALNNIRKHSGAKRALVELRYEEKGISLTVADDGQGFDWRGVAQRAWSEKKFGLLGMQERARIMGGNFNVESIPGKGTAVRIQLAV